MCFVADPLRECDTYYTLFFIAEDDLLHDKSYLSVGGLEFTYYNSVYGTVLKMTRRVTGAPLKLTRIAFIKLDTSTKESDDSYIRACLRISKIFVVMSGPFYHVN